MSYKLNLTDGSLLVELIDGKIDDTSTDLTFIGKNYQGFGEVLNENFIKLLENFNNTVPPSNPVTGQIWYDRVTGRIKVYNGTTFRNIDNIEFVSGQPTEKLEGDLWINSQTDQMYFYNGTEYVLVGPNYTKVQGLNGYFTDTVISKETGQNKIINKIYSNGNVVAIVSNSEFTPVPSILGFPKIFVGYNISTLYPDFKFNGVANTAINIQDENGNVFDVTSFVKSSAPTGPGDYQTMQSPLFVANDFGLRLGANGQYNISTNGTLKHETTNLLPRFDLKIDGTSSIYIDNTSSQAKAMGIFTDGPVNPQNAINPDTGLPYERNYVDLNGDLTVRGDLRVEGEQMFVDATNIRVEDKNIILGLNEDSSTEAESNLPRNVLDEAGIIVASSEGSIDWVYQHDILSWTSSENINLRNVSQSYKIGGQDVLSRTELSSTVTSAAGITQLGNLEELTVDEISIDGNTISSLNDMILDVNGNFAFSTTKKISNVATPVVDTDVANKEYVDNQVATLPVILPIDVTNLGITYDVENTIDSTLINNVIGILEQIAPPGDYLQGTIARVLATRYTYEAYSLDLIGSVGATLSIASATQANPVVITTTTNHNKNNGDEIIIFDVIGMTALNNERYYVKTTGLNTFELYTDSALQNSLDGTGFNAYNSSGQLGQVAPATPVFAVETDAFDAGGNLNKTAVISAGHIAETEVEVTPTVSRLLIYFEEDGSSWVHNPLYSRNDILA